MGSVSVDAACVTKAGLVKIAAAPSRPLLVGRETRSCVTATGCVYAECASVNHITWAGPVRTPLFDWAVISSKRSGEEIRMTFTDRKSV